MKFLSNMLLCLQICKDKEEVEVWFVALKTLICRGNIRIWRVEPTISERTSSETNSPNAKQKTAPSFCTDPLHEVGILDVSWIFKLILETGSFTLHFFSFPEGFWKCPTYSNSV